jgi:hypothetical protein
MLGLLATIRSGRLACGGLGRSSLSRSALGRRGWVSTELEVVEAVAHGLGGAAWMWLVSEFEGESILRLG